MPIDINLVRVEKGGDPELVRESQRKRFANVEVVDQVIELDAICRKAKYQMDTLNMKKNQVSKIVAQKKKDSKGQDKCEEEIAQSKAFDVEIAAQKVITEEAIKKQEKALNSIGNIVHANTVISKTEDDNKVVRTFGEPNKELKVDGSALGKLHHHEVMQCLDMIEFERGQRVAGHRGYYLKGVGVLLNNALIQYGMTTLRHKDYTPIQPPFFMKKEVMEATCQLSDFAENLYKVEGGEDEKATQALYLTATSEQPISAMHMGEWLHPDELPKKYAGQSTCFRKEAGAHGRDVWGIFRVHQFEKVEQFIYCDPSKSTEEFDKMIGTAESFYQGLKLPYQVINIASGALNDAAAIKYDLEAWFPGYDAFRELVSCSNCTDYQARALEVRYAKRDVDDKLYVHMLNGTMCATERTMCCIVENYQTAEGLVIPEVLRPFMGGIDFVPYNEAAAKLFFKQKEDQRIKEEQKNKAKGGKAKEQKPKEEKKQAPKQEKSNKKQAEEKKVEPQAAHKERTFIMIKPDGVQRGLVGKIIQRFEKRGFKLAAMKVCAPGKAHLEQHYADLAKKPFFPGLVEYMTSGPVCAMIWEGDNVVATGRKMLGATKPFDSAPGTIRGDFCIDVGRNICHGSDSVESAQNEIKLWFGQQEVTQYAHHSQGWVYE